VGLLAQLVEQRTLNP